MTARRAGSRPLWVVSWEGDRRVEGGVERDRRGVCGVVGGGPTAPSERRLSRRQWYPADLQRALPSAITRRTSSIQLSTTTSDRPPACDNDRVKMNRWPSRETSYSRQDGMPRTYGL